MSSETVNASIIVHTLGPAGTNCEEAARFWIQAKGFKKSKVVLHATLEDGLQSLLENPADSVLVGCVVYPKLHEIVFSNLDRLELVDQFIMPTFNMVYASRGQAQVQVAASHPAPRGLIEGRGLDIEETTSNSRAANMCRAGLVDACITTMPAAVSNQLDILEDFGPVPMGFTVHAPKGQQ